MSESTYGNIIIVRAQEMDKEDGEETDKEDGEEMIIYGNADIIKSHNVCIRPQDIRRNQTSQQTGSECVKNRSQRSVVVCLVVLCVLLLTAVIVLCVLNYTNNHQFNNINIKNITEERNQLLTQKINLAKERDELLTQNNNLTKQRDQLKNERNARPKSYQGIDTWYFHKSSFYYISSERKNWTESRRYCQNKGADLVIINNKQEQGFVKSMSGEENVWIGLTDRDKEGTWKWVDNSTMTSRFWKSGEPNSKVGDEDCVVICSSGWADYMCTEAFKWMCEKKLEDDVY